MLPLLDIWCLSLVNNIRFFFPLIVSDSVISLLFKAKFVVLLIECLLESGVEPSQMGK